MARVTVQLLGDRMPPVLLSASPLATAREIASQRELTRFCRQNEAVTLYVGDARVSDNNTLSDIKNEFGFVGGIMLFVRYEPLIEVRFIVSCFNPLTRLWQPTGPVYEARARLGDTVAAECFNVTQSIGYPVIARLKEKIEQVVDVGLAYECFVEWIRNGVIEFVIEPQFTLMLVVPGWCDMIQIWGSMPNRRFVETVRAVIAKRMSVPERITLVTNMRVVTLCDSVEYVGQYGFVHCEVARVVPTRAFSIENAQTYQARISHSMAYPMHGPGNTMRLAAVH